MQTGEGKTLAATLPMYLASLTGKSALLDATASTDPEVDRDAVDRALEHYAENCPAYQSIKGCIECSWGLEIVRAA